jgi:ABC-type nitrate/sulfonate/bicarbonate transport system substrate-binding protein
VVNLNTSAYEAVYDGSADFTIPFVTWQGVEAELSDRPLKLFRFTDYGIPDWYGVILISNKGWITEEPDLARRFVQATVRGFEDAAKDPAGTAKILIDANADTFSNTELVERSAQLLADEYFLDADGRFGTQTAEMWEGYTQFLFDGGALTDADGNALASPPSAVELFTDGLRSP